MAKFINQNMDDKRIRFSLVKMNANEFNWYVDCQGWYSNDIDYDPATEKYNVIMVTYPAEYYAAPQYLTTKILNKLFKASNRTAESFIKEIHDYVAI